MVLGAGGHGGLSWLVSEGHVSDEGVKGCLFCSAVFLGVLYILSEGQEFSPLRYCLRDWLVYLNCSSVCRW